MYSANEQGKGIMKTKFLGLFALFITAIGFALPAHAMTWEDKRGKPTTDLDHPGQQASNFPPQLREFKQVMNLPEDLVEIYSTRGACSEANGWTGVKNATGSYSCGEYTSRAQGSKWKAVFHASKGYKLFKLEPYVENGQRKSRWVLKVDHDEQRGLYAANGSPKESTSGTRGGTPTIAPPVDNTTQDLLKKASDLFRK